MHAANNTHTQPLIIINKMMKEGVALLLQERFRQLQRMKELREEREMVRLMLYTNYNYFAGSSLLLPPTSTSHFRPPVTPWPESNPSKSCFANDNSAPDIDTSLHL